MILKFKKFLEMTGYQSWNWGIGASIPSTNLTGVTSDTSGTNFIRGAYGPYDNPQNPTKSSLGNYRDELRKGIITGIQQLDLPKTIKKGTIKGINYTKNPIMIHMSDGTRLFLSINDYRNIGSPEKGSTLTVTMQRRPDDYSRNPSIIQNIEVS